MNGRTDERTNGRKNRRERFQFLQENSLPAKIVDRADEDERFPRPHTAKKVVPQFRIHVQIWVNYGKYESTSMNTKVIDFLYGFLDHPPLLPLPLPLYASAFTFASASASASITAFTSVWVEESEHYRRSKSRGGVEISLRIGGQGQTIPIHFPLPIKLTHLQRHRWIDERVKNAWWE